MPIFPNAPTRRTVIGLLAAGCALPHTALANTLDMFEGRAFGTYWRLSGGVGRDLAALMPEIDALFAAQDRVFSPYRQDSDISAFNAGEAGAVHAAPELLRVAQAALDIARHSDGAFDPTVGPLVARLGFGPIAQGGPRDWRALSVRDGTLSKARADLTLDLCGIAKGWALDRAGDLLRGAGDAGALLDVGGELLAIGQHPAGRDWRVAVEAPLLGQRAPMRLRLPDGMAVATSGTRAQSYWLNDTFHSHIIGREVQAQGRARSVTVLAGDAMTADGWATALCAAGAVDGLQMAQKHRLAALFLTDGPNGLAIQPSDALADFVL